MRMQNLKSISYRSLQTVMVVQCRNRAHHAVAAVYNKSKLLSNLVGGVYNYL